MTKLGTVLATLLVSGAAIYGVYKVGAFTFEYAYNKGWNEGGDFMIHLCQPGFKLVNRDESEMMVCLGLEMPHAAPETPFQGPVTDLPRGGAPK